jgi:putative spermidine/putrescine transport system substrate-binding protein
MKRRLVTTALAICAALVLAACGGDDSDDGGGGDTGGGGTDLSGQTATFVTFDIGQEPQFRPAFLDPVEQDTGLKIAFDSPTDYAKLQAQVESGNVDWTVVQTDPWWTEAYCGDLIERVKVEVPNEPPAFDSGPCGTPADAFAFLPTYDSEAFTSDPPKDWADFFDTEKYPGKRAVWGSYAINGVLEGALLADGVPEDQLYPLDLERAFAKLDTIKDDIAFYDTLGQALSMMESGDVAMAAITNSQGYDQTGTGGTFEPMWDGALLSWDSYAVPKGANVEAAKAILESLADPERQATLAESGAFGAISGDSKPQLSDDQKKWNPTTDENVAQSIPMDQKYYAENSDEVIQRYTEWVSG